ncbi:solute carrier family 35 member G1 isoform X2 [Eurytemora carolleeae]|uniref:solute carrier family 35 member G1 isoform X2 n=1 Tax=Eurytemora carolleeae TaxID=1294199 RepID=UPI000C77120F|nr:solute carrier family 35 member G1 isoform X2 [Eurytemora carolleeae]|eukprot:XP_023348982.1 solute carrier family 35 member G1-like isoform X2 [Eurytemora affinis]
MTKILRIGKNEECDKIADRNHPMEIGLMLEKEDEDNSKTDEMMKNNDVEGLKEEKKTKCYKKIIGLGLILTLIKIILSSLSDLLVKKLDNVHPITLLFYRSLAMLSLIFPISIGTNKPPFPADTKPKERFLLVLRGVLGCVGAMAVFYALQHMPLGDQKMIISCRPVLSIISARIFLKEPCGKFEILATLLMMSGVVLVIQPDFIFGTMGLGVERDSEFFLAAILLLASTILTANVSIILRYLRKENIVSIIISRELQYTILTFMVVSIVGLPLATLDTWDKLRVLTMACVTLSCCVLNILALKLEQANKIVLMDRSSAIVVAFTIQIVVFGDYPGLLTCIGVGLAMCAIFLLGVKKIFLSKKPKEDSVPSA